MVKFTKIIQDCKIRAIVKYDGHRYSVPKTLRMKIRPMTIANAFYAQSGGATAVINSSACGLIETARQRRDRIHTVYAGHNGIIGALKEALIDTQTLSSDTIAALNNRPGCAFGSCRYKLKPFHEDERPYRRLIEVFDAHHIRYFFYNGGNDSQDTTHKIAEVSQTLGYPLTCIGIPKTIDNDLPHTDFTPGYPSAAKYIAIAIKEAAIDLMSMCASSTQIFILEVMGRHTGWLAAAAGLAQQHPNDAPHIILFPERPFEMEPFLARVKHCVSTHGCCVIAVAEGICRADGRFIHHSSNLVDVFGHEALGGVAPVLAHLIKKHLGYRYHWAVCDYLQRAARHIASATDVTLAYQLGAAAIDAALAGHSSVMMTIERHALAPEWRIGTAPLNHIANVEKPLPAEYIREDGFGITPACRDYLLPLIQGEAYPPYENGLPHYAPLTFQCVEKKLTTEFDCCVAA